MQENNLQETLIPKNPDELEEELAAKPGQWFVISCNTSQEDRVLLDLIQKIKSSNLESEVFDVRVFKHEVTVKSRSGNDLKKMKTNFPGYIFINMIMSERAWFLIRNTPGVNGFIGSSGKGAKPFPLSIQEVLDMLYPVNKEPNSANNSTNKEANEVSLNQVKKEIQKANFEVNDIVRIKNGTYSGEEGKVIEIDEAKGVAVIEIEMFGRYTPTEVQFNDVEPVKEY